MRPARLTAVLAVAVLASSLTACVSSASDSGGSGDTAAGVTTLKLGAVPTIDIGLIQVAKDQGYFADAKLDVQVTNVDAGPTAVTGVIAGQYDLAYSAYAPPLIALAGNAPLRVVVNSAVIGPEGANGGVLVRKDSGITSFAQLAGKKVGSNAARALLSLAIPAAVTKAGADSSGIEIVPLPFTQLADAVERGQVDAAGIIEPYQTKALAQYPDLVDLGDTYSYVFDEGMPGGAFYTSEKTQSAKGDAIKAFADAMTKTEEYANDHLDEVRTAGATLAGLKTDDAAHITVGPYTPEVTADSLKPYADMMVAQGWVKTPPDLSAFVSGLG